MTSIGEKIKAGREVKRWTQSALAARIGVTRNAVSQWESDKNGPGLGSLLKLCAELGLSPSDFSVEPQQSSPSEPVVGMPIRGEVRAGAWLEHDGDGIDFGTLPTIPDPRYPNVEQFALRVVGTSMNKIAAPGQYVIVASWAELGAELKDGDLVVVRRERAMTYEATLKRAKKNGRHGNYGQNRQTLDTKNQ